MAIALTRREMPGLAVFRRSAAKGLAEPRLTLEASHFITFFHARLTLASTDPPWLVTERVALDTRAEDVVCLKLAVIFGNLPDLWHSATKMKGRERSGQVNADSGRAPQRTDVRNALDTIATEGGRPAGFVWVRFRTLLLEFIYL